MILCDMHIHIPLTCSNPPSFNRKFNIQPKTAPDNVKKQQNNIDIRYAKSGFLGRGVVSRAHVLMSQ